MHAKSTQAERYMLELWRRMDGNCNAQVSMFDIGATIGLEKEAARKLAEDLIADGLVQIKTLSGGIGITALGLDRVQSQGVSGPKGGLDLGKGPLLDDKGRRDLETILNAIKTSIAASAKSYERLEEMVIDLKTMDVQLLSPRPKTAVLKEVLRSLKEGLEGSGASDLAGDVEKMIGA